MSAFRCAVPVLVAALVASGGLGPDEGATAERAKREWAEWTAREGYACTIVGGGRALIWGSKGSRASKLARVAGRTLLAFDELVPPDPREEAAPPPRTASLFELEDRADLASLVAGLGERHEALAAWAPAAARGVGFALEEPLAAGWLAEVPDNEVWSPENELANRLARLLTIERYGRLPHWLEMGLAWQIELDVCKDVHCFPFRSGFVSKKEHKSWDARLAAATKARGEDATVGVEELSSWTRGTWDEVRASLAWGAAAMLARHYEDELPGLLAAYAAERREKGREVHADGSWEALPDYELPPGLEEELLDRELGVDFAAELTRFARAPRSYRRPR